MRNITLFLEHYDLILIIKKINILVALTLSIFSFSIKNKNTMNTIQFGFSLFISTEVFKWIIFLQFEHLNLL